jgi:cyclic pyranopterin phosphate synthase
MHPFTHLDEKGDARMVDVSPKDVTPRVAIAAGTISMSKEALDLLRRGEIAKGNVLTIAKAAGILAAKRTADMIPLCHPLLLEHVDLEFTLARTRIDIRSTVKLTGRTGAEMEALMAVSIAALTIYDMCKAVDRTMRVREVRLLEKSGGRSGHFRAEEAGPKAAPSKRGARDHAGKGASTPVRRPRTGASKAHSWRRAR